MRAENTRDDPKMKNCQNARLSVNYDILALLLILQKMRNFVQSKTTHMQTYNGTSADKRKQAVLNIYEAYKNTGLSNRYIWKHYIYPTWGISERTFYHYLKHSA